MSEKLPTMELYRYTGKAKQMLSPSMVCMDKSQIFTTLLKYAYSIEYEDEPNYDYIKKELTIILK